MNFDFQSFQYKTSTFNNGRLLLKKNLAIYLGLLSNPPNSQKIQAPIYQRDHYLIRNPYPSSSTVTSHEYLSFSQK